MSSQMAARVASTCILALVKQIVKGELFSVHLLQNVTLLTFTLCRLNAVPMCRWKHLSNLMVLRVYEVQGSKVSRASTECTSVDAEEKSTWGVDLPKSAFGAVVHFAGGTAPAQTCVFCRNCLSLCMITRLSNTVP